MNVPSIPVKQQKVGSNLKAHKALVAANQALVKRRNEPISRAERKFLRARAALLKPIVKPATIICGEAKAALSQAILRAGGDGAAIANARRRARRTIDRALHERVTGYHEYETLRQNYADESRALIAARREASTIGGLDIQIGNIPLRPDLAPQVFRPPFALFDTESPASGVESFAVPRAGLVGINRRFFDFAGFDDDIIGVSFNPGVEETYHALIGITFTVPRTGFLFGAAVMQNLTNDFTISLTDESGVSDGNVGIDHSITLRIVRSGEITAFDRLVYSRGFQSFGQDLGISESPIPRSTPFTLNFESRDAFLKGERIQILAGASLTMKAHVNDMRAVMAAFTVWDVKALSLAIRA
jgi:hypothetical protein